MIGSVIRHRPEWLGKWLARHQDPRSRVLHLVGIPLTLGALMLAAIQLGQWRWDLWWRPVGLLLGGYLLQFLGHLAEGNEMGEVIVIKKLLGRRYRAISPRFDSLADPPLGPARVNRPDTTSRT